MAPPETTGLAQSATADTSAAAAAQATGAEPGKKRSILASLLSAVLAFLLRLLRPLNVWFRVAGAWYASSLIFHTILMCVLMLIFAKVASKVVDEAPSFESTQTDPAMESPPALEQFELGNVPLDPTELNTETLSMTKPPQIEQTEQINDDNPVFAERGGGIEGGAAGSSLGGVGGFDIVGLGSGIAVRGRGGVGTGIGTGVNPGSGGSGSGFGGRGSGMRKAMVGGFGGTKQSERAVAGALNWLARHQSNDGRWSLQDYRKLCKDRTCTGPGDVRSDVAATALGLLPFLAAGQTQDTKGSPYRNTVHKGLYWLMTNQAADGDLAGNNAQKMYCHGLAAITLCEAYGLTRDRMVGQRAQRAIDFIQAVQHPVTGGWRYQPGEEGDTSVLGWQVMALKSAQMAGLKVNPKTFDGAKTFLKLVSKGNGGLFSYVAIEKPSPPMTAVGLLCSQYMGLKRNDPLMLEGLDLLKQNLPDPEHRDVYYWYYATQVLHNVPGPDWDQWNRAMRRTLIETQCREGCAAGSWDPSKPTRDKWGQRGGRLMMTSLGALTLEVYYRYLPLYKLDKLDAEEAAKPAGAKPDKPAQTEKTEKAKKPEKVEEVKDTEKVEEAEKKDASEEPAKTDEEPKPETPVVVRSPARTTGPTEGLP